MHASHPTWAEPAASRLEVLSWWGSIVAALAVLVALLLWAWRRWYEAGVRPFGLVLALDRATSDPGHRIFVLNGRASPIVIDLWGVVPADLAPRTWFSRVVSERRVERAALDLVADTNGPRHTDLTLQPGDYRYLMSASTPEQLVPPDLMKRWQVPYPEPEVEAEVDRLTSMFEAYPMKSDAWNARTKLCAFVLVPGVGFVFGKATRGPFSEGNDYPGYPCQHCEHDYQVHERSAKRGLRTLRVRQGPCQDCGCDRFRGHAPLPSFHYRAHLR